MQTIAKYSFLFLLLLFAAFFSRKAAQTRQDLISFKFSTFRWTFSGATDTLVFRLLSYLEMDSDGHYRLMRRDSFDAPPRYAVGLLQDSLRQKVSNTLTGNDPKGVSWTLQENYIYNGPYYAIDYQIGRECHFIKFISPQLPPELRPLFESLVYFTDTASVGNWEKLDLSDYQEWLKNQTEPPPMPVLPPIKFSPPKSG